MEWNTLITYRYNTKNPSSTESYTSLNSFSDSNFNTTFKIPLAGYRNYDGASLNTQNLHGRYLSSSPSGSSNPNRMRSARFDPPSVNTVGNYYRTYGLSIRCFKDSPKAPETLTLTFDGN